ncbi:MAG: hypothetical protein JWO94_2703 [Verrucomicrobiaceae bacterium]|nr:hypothetical protein [Verrucomicrobiaceae bacterium]
MDWYYANNGKQLGPVSGWELKNLAEAGSVGISTLVWRPGQGDWRPLAEACPSVLGTAAADVPQFNGLVLVPSIKDSVMQQLREGVITDLPGPVEYGGFWLRVVASFIDGQVLSIVQLLISIAWMTFNGPTAAKAASAQPMMFDADEWKSILSAVGGGALLGILYSSVMVSLYGATWGKMALQLRIVAANGSKITAPRAIGRAFAEIINIATLDLGYLIVAFDVEKRALHDYICGTRVIRAR